MSYAELLCNRGVALHRANHLEEALASYDEALALKPDHAEALYNRGNVLWGLGRFEEALASTDKAVKARPRYVEALYNRGVMLHRLKRPEKALRSLDAALALRPDFVEALNNRGGVLQDMARFEEALASYEKALAIDPRRAGLFYNRGTIFKILNRFEEALRSFETALALDPGHRDAFGCLAGSALYLCDWMRTAKFAGALEARVATGKFIVAPLTFLGYCSDAGLQLQCAKNYIRDRIPVPPRPLWNAVPYRHDRIRIAYLSADYHQHAIAFLTAELFERHDRNRFEVIGISIGADDGSEMRARLVQAFDRFHDVRSRSDEEAAKLLRTLEADIVVDLGGHTQGSRPEILSYRPAPMQVNYLGYPGTMGADFIDYVIADPHVLPFDRQPFFTEKIVHLPDCYQVNDSKRAVVGNAPTRDEAGLPENGFVLCCFNNNWKITAPIFDVWMRLLGAIPGSVLWLIEDNGGASTHLRAEAQARGIDPQRIIFAARMKHQDHLARHRLADLFLDTLPYNAHTTASDALWLGVPLVTCLGEAFAGRVAASLLHAIGLPELVTHNMEEYEAFALKLAQDPSLLQSLRRKLEQNRLTTPLFDTDRFRHNIEAAYTRMWEIAERGEPAQSFAVAPQQG